MVSTSNSKLDESILSTNIIKDTNSESTSFTDDSILTSISNTNKKNDESFTSSTFISDSSTYKEESTKEFNTESTTYPNNNQFDDSPNIRTSIITNDIKISESISDTNIISTNDNYKNSDLTSQSTSGEMPNSPNINTFDDYNSEFISDSNIITEGTSKEREFDTTNESKDSTYYSQESNINEDKPSYMNSYNTDKIKQSSQSATESTSFTDDGSIINDSNTNEKSESSITLSSESTHLNKKTNEFNSEAFSGSHSNDEQFSDISTIRTSINTNDIKISESIYDTKIIPNNNNYENTNDISSSFSELSSSNIKKNEYYSSEIFTDSNINIEETSKETIIGRTNEPKDSTYFISELNTNEDKSSYMNTYSTNNKLKENSGSLSKTNDNYISSEPTSFTDDKTIINNSITRTSDTNIISTNLKSASVISSFSSKFDEIPSSSNINTIDDYSSEFFIESSINTEETTKGIKIEASNEPRESSDTINDSKINENKYSDINSYFTDNKIKESSESLSDTKDNYISPESAPFSVDNSIILSSNLNKEDNETNRSFETPSSDVQFIGDSKNDMISTSNLKLDESIPSSNIIKDTISESISFTDDSELASISNTNKKDDESFTSSEIISDSRSYKEEGKKELNTESTIYPKNNLFESSNIRTSIVTNINKGSDILSSSTSKLYKEIPSSNINKNEDYSSEIFIESSINTEETSKETKVEIINEQKDITYYSSEENINDDKSSYMNSISSNNEMKEISESMSNINKNYISSEFTSFSDDNLIRSELNTNKKNDEPFSSSSSYKEEDTKEFISRTITDSNDYQLSNTTISTNDNFQISDSIYSSSNLEKEISSLNINNMENSHKEEIVGTIDTNYFTWESSIIKSEDKSYKTDIKSNFVSSKIVKEVHDSSENISYSNKNSISTESTSFYEDNAITSDFNTEKKEDKSFTNSETILDSGNYMDKNTQKLHTESTTYQSVSQFLDDSNMRTSIITSSNEMPESMPDTNNIPTNNNFRSTDYSSDFFTESSINTEKTSKDTKIGITNGSKDSTYYTSEANINEDKSSYINSYSTDSKPESTLFTDDNTLTTGSDSNMNTNIDYETSEIKSGESTHSAETSKKFYSESSSDFNDIKLIPSSNITTSIISNSYEKNELLSDTNIISTNFKSTDVISASSSSNINQDEYYSSDFINDSSINIGATSKGTIVETTNELKDSTYFTTDSLTIKKEYKSDYSEYPTDNYLSSEPASFTDYNTIITNSSPSTNNNYTPNDNSEIMSESFSNINDENKEFKTEGTSKESIRGFTNDLKESSYITHEATRIRTSDKFDNDLYSTDNTIIASPMKDSKEFESSDTNNNEINPNSSSDIFENGNISEKISSSLNDNSNTPTSSSILNINEGSEFFPESSINNENTSQAKIEESTYNIKDSTNFISESDKISILNTFDNSDINKSQQQIKKQVKFQKKYLMQLIMIIQNLLLL